MAAGAHIRFLGEVHYAEVDSSPRLDGTNGRPVPVRMKGRGKAAEAGGGIPG
jgi:hypothetical protein